MMNSDAALEEWKKLYGLAATFAEKKPWTYLNNENLIQISPAGIPTGYFSILGAGGYQCGCLFYLGEAGLNDHLCILDASEMNISMEYAYVHQNCLSMCIGDRDEVSEEQYRIMKKIGLRSRGKGNWIYFEQYETGYCTSLLKSEEVRTMTIYMEAMLEALDRMKKEKISLDILQVYSFVEKENQWIGSIEEFPQNSYHLPACYLMNDIRKARTRKISKANQYTGSFDFLMDYLMSSVAESPKDKPYMPLWIGIGDTRQGIVLDFVLINPVENVYEAVWELLERCIKKFGIPSVILVENEIASSMLEQFCHICGIELEQTTLALREFFSELQNGMPMVREDESEALGEMLIEFGKMLDQFDLNTDDAMEIMQTYGLFQGMEGMEGIKNLQDFNELGGLFEQNTKWKMGYSDVVLKSKKEKIEALEVFFGVGTWNCEGFEGFKRRMEFTCCNEDWKKELKKAYKKDLQEYASELGAEVKGSYGKDMLSSMILSILEDNPRKVHRLLTKSEEKAISYLGKRAKKSKSELPLEKFPYSEAELIRLLKIGIIDISLESNGETLFLTIKMCDTILNDLKK